MKSSRGGGHECGRYSSQELGAEMQPCAGMVSFLFVRPASRQRSCTYRLLARPTYLSTERGLGDRQKLAVPSGLPIHYVN